MTLNWPETQAQEKQQQPTTRQTSPVSYAFNNFLRSPDTKRQYPKMLELFFDHIGLPGNSVEEKGLAFLAKAAENKRWTEEKIVLFLTHHRQRVDSDEIIKNNKIKPGTLKNYYRPIKTFYDAHSDDFEQQGRLSPYLQLFLYC